MIIYPLIGGWYERINGISAVSKVLGIILSFRWRYLNLVGGQEDPVELQFGFTSWNSEVSGFGWGDRGLLGATF